MIVIDVGGDEYRRRRLFDSAGEWVFMLLV